MEQTPRAGSPEATKQTESPRQTPIIFDPKQYKGKSFIISGNIDHKPFQTQVIALNLQSLIAQMTFVTAINVPRVQGWNIIDPETKELLASVDALSFLEGFTKATPLSLKPADPKTAGWSAVPVVSGLGEDFAESIAKAKKGLH